MTPQQREAITLGFNTYQELALRTNSPITEETVERWQENNDVIEEGLRNILGILNTFDPDKLKREIYYKKSSDGCPLTINNECQFIHGLLGKLGELYELIEAYLEDFDAVHYMEELGDLQWYNNLMAHALNVELSTVALKNIEKLMARYPEKFSEQLSIERDLERERRILEMKGEVK